jgi:hypothetical protein
VVFAAFTDGAVEARGQPMAEPGARLEDWKQRAAVVQSHRERSD